MTPTVSPTAADAALDVPRKRGRPRKYPARPKSNLLCPRQRNRRVQSVLFRIGVAGEARLSEIQRKLLTMTGFRVSRSAVASRALALYARHIAAIEGNADGEALEKHLLVECVRGTK